MNISNSFSLPYIDPRSRVAAIVLLSWAHLSPTPTQLALLALLSTFISFIYRAQLSRYSLVLASTIMLLAIAGVGAWLLGSSRSIDLLLLDLVRFFSLVVACLVLLVSMNSLELMSALAWFGVPRRIALALGVAFRFVPLFFENAKRLWWMHGQRSSGLEGVAGSSWLHRVRSMLPLMFIDVLRRIESIMLAIMMQDIEGRLATRRQPPLGLAGLSCSLGLVLFPVALLLW